MKYKGGCGWVTCRNCAIYIRHLSICALWHLQSSWNQSPTDGGMTVVVSIGLDVPKVIGSLRNARHSGNLPLCACPTGKLGKLGTVPVAEDGGRQEPVLESCQARLSQVRCGFTSGYVNTKNGFSHVHETCGDVCYTASVW